MSHQTSLQAAPSSRLGGGPRGFGPTGLLLGILAIIVGLIVGFAVFFGGIPLLSAIGGSGGNALGGGYAIEFNESGLSPGSAWQVNLSGQSQTSDSSSMTFYLPNGSYGYGIPSSAGLNATTPFGIVRVVGGPDWLPVVFSAATPLETVLQFTFGFNESTWGAIPGCPVDKAHYCFGPNFVVHGTIQTSDLLLCLWNAEGQLVPWPAGVTVTLPSSNWMAPPVAATYDIANGSWTLLPPFNGTLTDGDQWLTLYTNSTGPGGDLGSDYLVVVGVGGGYAGTSESYQLGHPS